MTLKEEVYIACENEIKNRLNFFHKILSDLKEGAQNDAKSSAGDKHETSLSMMQIEQEKIRKQLSEVQEMNALLEKLNPQIITDKINLGSLIKTNIGYFYIAVALGKLKLNAMDLYVISQQSPMALKLLGLRVDNEIVMNSKKIVIQDIN
jgi:transcription elongation GreA/GreB family factor